MLLHRVVSKSGARATVNNHARLHGLAFLLFGLNAWLQADDVRNSFPIGKWSVSLSIAGFICTLMAGFLGWTLVQKYHVGVESSPTEPFESKKDTQQRPTG